MVILLICFYEQLFYPFIMLLLPGSLYMPVFLVYAVPSKLRHLFQIPTHKEFHLKFQDISHFSLMISEQSYPYYPRKIKTSHLTVRLVSSLYSISPVALVGIFFYTSKFEKCASKIRENLPHPRHPDISQVPRPLFLFHFRQLSYTEAVFCSNLIMHR